jgi:hypothetical protein
MGTSPDHDVQRSDRSDLAGKGLIEEQCTMEIVLANRYLDSTTPNGGGGSTEATRRTHRRPQNPDQPRKEFGSQGTRLSFRLVERRETPEGTMVELFRYNILRVQYSNSRVSLRSSRHFSSPRSLSSVFLGHYRRSYQKFAPTNQRCWTH